MSGFAIYPSLRDRTVVVTGGASGIGASLVEAFARQHAQVLFLDLPAAHETATALITRLTAEGLPAPIYLPCDLSDQAALETTLDHLYTLLPEVHVLVNNAGNDLRHTLAEVTSDFWDHAMAVNLKHQFFMTRGLLPALRAAAAASPHGASVINMSSISWQIPSTGLPVYVTAKAAIVGLTRTLAHELGPDNIRVNAVLPGAIATEKQNRLWLTESYKAEVLSRQAIKRMIAPEEVARLVLFLAADDSSAITNQSYNIDAGWT